MKKKTNSCLIIRAISRELNRDADELSLEFSFWRIGVEKDVDLCEFWADSTKTADGVQSVPSRFRGPQSCLPSGRALLVAGCRCWICDDVFV